MTATPVTVEIVKSAPRGAEAVGVPVASSGPVPRQLGLSRAALSANGFDGKPGQVLVLPSAAGPTLIAIGIGDPSELTANGLRSAAASLVRAAGKRTTIATSLADLEGVDSKGAGQAVVEGALLAAYRYIGLKTDTSGASTLARISLVVGDKRTPGVRSGVERGTVTARAVHLARDLANTPPAYLTARKMAERAVAVAAETGLGVEVFDKDKLAAMGCGGMIGVNQGSTEPPRMVKLTYTPRNPTGHLVLVGKGVMYDSGGISLKPSDASHAKIKMDMSGAAAVLATMSTLKALKCRAQVTGYLMCTDNMPSGSALKLGDVLTFRNGKTAEIHNTDAEGRLVLADALTYAEQDLGATAIVDVATLTGGVVVALGHFCAGWFCNDEALTRAIESASEESGERLWRLPLWKEHRDFMRGQHADLINSNPARSAHPIQGAAFLSHFVGEKTPWAHVDIAGVGNVDGANDLFVAGPTGWGVRLLTDWAETETK